MLTAAGVAHDAEPAHVDEDAVKAAFRGEGRSARDLADALAEMKAVKVSTRAPGALVLGCDSVVALDDGTMIDKAEDRDALAAQLRLMSGTQHSLYSAAVIAENGRPVWRHVDHARLYVRPLSKAFIESYLDSEGDVLLACAGGYRMEALGAQLFAKVEGSHFTVLGMPLLPILDYLRVRGVLTS